MRKAFYPKLAFDSLKRNRQIYIPYIFTGIVTIMMYYIFGTIVKNEGLNYLQGAEVVKLILRWTYAITGGFSVVFLFYTNRFLIKRRKKEMGVYQVLGLDKRNLTSMLFWETIYTAVSGIVGGVLLGLVFGKLIFLILLKILHTQVKFSYKILPSLILQTIIFYSIVYLFLFLWNLFQISRLDLVTLLRGENQGEREPKVKRVLALFGVVTIGIGYWIAQTTQTPLSALTNIFFAVILVIIGTYAIFVAGSIVFLKLLKKNKNIYYKKRYFTAISGLLYRMKQNAVGLANICILSTMVLILVSMTLSLYIGIEDVIKTRFPREFSVLSSNISREKIEKMNDIIEQEVVLHHVEIQEKMEYSYGEIAAQIQDKKVERIEPYGMEIYYTVRFLSLDAYNAIENQNFTLEEGEVLCYSKIGGDVTDEICFGEKSYKVKEKLESIHVGNFLSNNISKTVVFILPDIESVLDVLKNYDENLQYYIGVNLHGESEARLETVDTITHRLESEIQVGYTEYREYMEQNCYELYGGFLFLGIFIGLIFLIAIVFSIYYKQISEGYEDRDRFQIMQKVGMSHKEVKSSIRSQVLLVFFLPLITALLHVGASFPIMIKLLQLLNLQKIYLYYGCTIAVAVVFIIFYVIIYSITSKVYYKIVK